MGQTGAKVRATKSHLTLEDLKTVECIQALRCRPQRTDGVEGRNCGHVGHPIAPHRISRVVSEEQLERGQEYLQWVLRAEGDQGSHGGSLLSVQHAVADHLIHDRLPPVEWVLWNHHRDTTAAHSALHKVVAVVERRLGVPGCTQQLPKTVRKSITVQTRRVHVSMLVDHHQLIHLPQQKQTDQLTVNRRIGRF